MLGQGTPGVRRDALVVVDRRRVRVGRPGHRSPQADRRQIWLRDQNRAVDEAAEPLVEFRRVAHSASKSDGGSDVSVNCGAQLAVKLLEILMRQDH